MNKKLMVVHEIEEIGRAIIWQSIRTEETCITQEYINEVEAGAKRLLLLVKELRENDKEKVDESQDHA